MKILAKPLARELKPAIEAIHFITEKLRLEDQAETGSKIFFTFTKSYLVEDDWQYIAMIIDRVLLISYSICKFYLEKYKANSDF